MMEAPWLTDWCRSMSLLWAHLTEVEYDQCHGGELHERERELDTRCWRHHHAKHMVRCVTIVEVRDQRLVHRMGDDHDLMATVVHTLRELEPVICDTCTGP